MFQIQSFIEWIAGPTIGIYCLDFFPLTSLGFFEVYFYVFNSIIFCNLNFISVFDELFDQLFALGRFIQKLFQLHKTTLGISR